MLLFDPQTSGGLLVAVAAGRLPALLDGLKALDQPGWVIGEAVAGEAGAIQVV
jgi:selenide,water dikinase